MLWTPRGGRDPSADPVAGAGVLSWAVAVADPGDLYFLVGVRPLA